jgi:lactate dehydrogenase-like 2-hydroxyacid dehydrogenase
MTDKNRERLVVTGPIPDELRNLLSQSHDLVELADAQPGEPFRIAVTTSMKGFDSATMDRIPGLAMIACNGVGLDKIDLPAAEQRGIRVNNTPGVLTEDVADTAIGLMFAIARRIVEADRFVRAYRWGPEKMPLSRRISGGSLGVVGMGAIGQAIARRGNGLGMTVRYTTPRAKPELPWEHVADAATLAEQSDVLILACPGGPQTAGMINRQVLEKLGPRGFLINIARGEVVDEEALIEALAAHRIGGAALDVYRSEPDIDPRFFDLDNVVLQPHYAGLTAETRADIASKLDRDIAAFLAGTI